MPDFRFQLMEVLVGNREADAVLAQFRKCIDEREGREALELIDVDEKVTPCVGTGASARLNAASPTAVTRRPPRRDEPSSPNRPLARLTRSIRMPSGQLRLVLPHEHQG
jgi:hypothetical protein